MCAAYERLNGGQPIVRGAPAERLHEFDPDPPEGNFYLINSNPVTKELYLSDFAATTVYVYRQIAPQDRILVFTCNLHFGDNIGVFDSAAFVGSSVTIPMHASWINQDPQVKQMGIPKQIHHPKMGPTNLIGSPVNLSDTPPRFIRPAPLLGEHTVEILRHFGYDRKAIEGLRACGVI